MPIPERSLAHSATTATSLATPNLIVSRTEETKKDSIPTTGVAHGTFTYHPMSVARIVLEPLPLEAIQIDLAVITDPTADRSVLQSTAPITSPALIVVSTLIPTPTNPTCLTLTIEPTTLDSTLVSSIKALSTTTFIFSLPNYPNNQQWSLLTF
jgi:hypothetical protein